MSVLSALLIIFDEIGKQYGFFDGLPVICILLAHTLRRDNIKSAVKKTIATVFFPLAFIFILYERDISALLSSPADGDIISCRLALLCALLMTIGVAIITHSIKFRCLARKGGGTESFHVHSSSSSNHMKGSMGQRVNYIDCNFFTSQMTVENNLGQTDVYFSNIEAYVGGQTLFVDNRLGSTVIHAPRTRHLAVGIENSMGNVDNPSCGDPTDLFFI